MARKHAQYLAFAVRKAATRQGYLAYYLAQYQQQEGLSEEAIVEFVGCSGEDYYRLALCQVPDMQASDFADRLKRVAAYAGALTPQVAQIIRQVTTIEALRTASQSDQQNEAVAGQEEASVGGTALNLIQETQQMRGTADPSKKAATQRPPIRSALLAARDRYEQDTKEEEPSDTEPENRTEE
jgi:hypothetical protein